MFGKSNTIVNKDRELKEIMKRDIELQLSKRGVTILDINMEINTEIISLSIFINSTRRLT